MKRTARIFITAIQKRLEFPPGSTSSGLNSIIFYLLVLGSQGALATEINTFTVTDIESELALRYLNDQQTFYQGGIKTQQDTRPTFQEEFIVDTNSYIFHPNLLSMELGGSLLFDQSSFDTMNGKNSNNETLLGYNARLNFLNKKAYPVSVYYDKRNPSVSVGLGGRFLQENIKYGAELALLQPVSPVQITLTAYRQSVKGEGLDQVTDDDLEHADARLYRAYGKGNYAQLSYQIDNRDSRSGNPNLPIVGRTTSTTSTYFDSKNLLGDARKAELITNASYTTQIEYPRRKELRVNPIINWQHNDLLRSFYRLNYNDSSEENIDIHQTYLVSGVGYSGPRYNASMDLHGEDNQSTTLDYQNVGSSYMISHNRPIAIGAIELSYSGSMDYRDQTSSDDLFEIFGEQHIMIGTTPVTLQREFIDPSTPIEVWNTSRSQQYIESIDYRVLKIGSQTQLQRFSSGNIASGQTVLVDYSYQTGGTFAYDLISNNLQLNWNPSNFYQLYIRYRNSKQNLRSGTPTIPLNSLTNLTYGFNVDQPLLNGINFGGEVYFEEHREDINPYYRQSYDAYVDLPLPRLTNMRLSARRVLVDNERSVEDVDLIGYIFRLQTHPWLRARLSYESSYENDIGGTIDRTLIIHRFQLGWAFRQLSLTADAHYSTEDQGPTERERWAMKFILSRTF